MSSKLFQHPIVHTLALGAMAFTSLAPLKASAAGLKLPKEGGILATRPNAAAMALQNAFIDVAAKVSPSVVNISSEWTEDVQGFNGNMQDFFNFFSNGPNGPQGPRTFKQKERSLGSGFLVSPDGYILTNAHVIGKAEKVTVTFEDGTTYKGVIVGKDAKVDIAVVKITDNKKTFPYLILGDSDNIKVGQWAIAVGNPFALDHTVTTGVISAKGRNVPNPESAESLQSYIQTDASINPGNSGGPLLNIEGEVIGINNMIYTQNGGSVGIGFAIPSNIARKAAGDLANKGKIIRAGLGAVVQGLTPQMSRSFGLGNTEGALLSQINPGSAAEAAGLKAGDIVLSVDGERVTGSEDLVAKLYTHNPGDTVQLSILRNGVQNTLPVKLQELNETATNNPGPNEPDNGGNQGSSGYNEENSLGFSFQDQTPDVQNQLPPGAPHGPVITNILQDSAAAAGGLQIGDVILKLDNTAIYSTNQLATLLKKSNLKEGVRLYVWRNGEKVFAFLQTGDE